MVETIDIAIIGGGIFVQEAYFPSLKQLSPLANVKALYSRSASSAQAAAKIARDMNLGEVDVYHDGEASANLDSLLKRLDIKAVIIALPIQAQAEVIIKCLEAGKHVLSEKPMSPDVVTGARLVRLYEEQFKPRGLIWLVAENWEVEPGYCFAGDAVKRGDIGTIHTFSLAANLFVNNEGNKYYDTPWRMKPQHQGGFLLDAGVHNTALLRAVLPGRKLKGVTALAALNNEHMAPFDLIQAIFQYADGLAGSFSLNYGARGLCASNRATIVGANGSIEIFDQTIKSVPHIRVIIKQGKEGRESENVHDFIKCGVEKEVKNYLLAVSGTGNPSNYGNPRGALQDVATIQACLDSHGNLVDVEALVGVAI